MIKLFDTPNRAVISTVCITVTVILIIGILFAAAFFAGFSYRGKELAQNKTKENALADMRSQNRQDTDSDRYSADLEDGAGEGGTGEKTNAEIGIDQAKSIAADHAGYAVSEVSFSKTKLENDHGRTKYEIEFYKDFVEYEYEIDAESGEIIEFSSDWDD